MTCWNKEQLEQMLEDVINQLNLSEEVIAKHGPLGTPPAELVKLVLAQKDKEISLLKKGFVPISQKANMDIVYVVLCKYEGCEECNSGSHILGVFSTKVKADKYMREHENNKKNHLHYFWADVHACPVDEIYDAHAVK